MSFNFSKSKFVSAYTRCNKYVWLEKHRQEEKTPVSEFTESLFDNGHKVGELAKQYFNIDVDVTVLKENGNPDTSAMLLETEKHISLGTKTIAEASFSYNGFFCSVDILVKNDDGSYNIYEVKSSKRNLKKYKKYNGVKESYVVDASYQQYVLENCGIKVDKVFVVLLSETFIREKKLDLYKYFVICDVTSYTTALQDMVKDKLLEIEIVLNSADEPTTNFKKNCNGCDYFEYCSRHISSPSPFEIYDLDFSLKCQYYNDGVSFFDIPKVAKLQPAALKQIEYYNRPNEYYIGKDEIKKFLDTLRFPLYSLDFETYLAVLPEYEGMQTNTAIPFQYSLHIMKVPNGNYLDGSPDLEEKHFLDISGGDPRRLIAESLVENIPQNSCIVACHKSTEKGIIDKLATTFPDLAPHLLSFEYVDPQPLFKKGYYYTKAMGSKFSLKSILPALFPDDPSMDYHNLEGNVKNGTQAMNAIMKVKDLSEEETRQVQLDLEKYCALDTYAVVKIIEKLYEVIK